MPDHEVLIQRLEAALTALKAGDSAALDHLRLIVGDVVSGDKTEIGSISGSTVALGRHIEMTIHEGNLPEGTVTALSGLIEDLRTFMRRGWERHSGEERRRVTLFLSSPSDVAEERSLALKIVERLNKNQFLPFRIEAFLWEHVDMAMFAHRNPQANIDSRIMPADCDIVVVALWSKMGTPMREEYVKPEAFRFALPAGDEIDPARYLSGTEYEFVNAMQGAEADGHPLVLAYRRIEDPGIKYTDPDRRAKTLQWDRVEAFFANFSRPDGSARWSYIPYGGPAEFAERFEMHLLDAIGALSYAPAPQSASHAAPVQEPQPWPAGKSPFPGLRPFQPEDAVVFFGRERETDSLVRRLRRDHFVAIVAASGSGKSSLARAGLIPRLLDGALPDAPRWAIAMMKPGEAGGRPLQALADALTAALPGGSVTADEDAESLARRVAEALPTDQHLLLLVDQFEEVFTVAEEAQRAPFAAAMAALSRLDRARVLITMRADFYHRCMEIPALKALIEDGTFPLYPPDRTQLYDMIARPAGVAGLAFEEGLEERIWRETAEEPGALALVAYTLERLWQAQENGMLRVATYKSFGDPASGISGVEGAIGAEAEAAYRALDDAAQDALPMVFARLVSVSRAEDGGLAATRRVADRVAVTSQPGTAAARLVEALEARRLLVADRDPRSGRATLEVAHEAIFRSWGRLRDWIQQAGEALRLVEDLKRQVVRWLESRESPNFLWTQEQMDPVLAALEKHPELRGELDEDCWRFLRPEYDRIWEEINAPVPEIRDDTELREYHRRRAALGDRLNDLGDCEKRPGIGLVKGLLPLNPHEGSAPMLGGRMASGQIAVPAGARRLWGDQPEHEELPDILWLPVRGGDQIVENQRFTVKPFYTAYYLLTNWQFRAFEVAEDGWDNPRWWQGLAADDDDRQKKDPHRPTGNHPRETVSWYGALAFCAWLSARLGYPTLYEWLQSTGNTWENYPGLRLPTEWEWQWAASGEGRSLEYPFGAWDGAKANTSESGLSRTTAAGLYPAGVAPCGALDMSGNVSEWCLNKYEQPENTSLSGNTLRVLRGGSWDGDQDYACTSSRVRGYPFNRYDDRGFRVVVGGTHFSLEL